MPYALISGILPEPLRDLGFASIPISAIFADIVLQSLKSDLRSTFSTPAAAFELERHTSSPFATDPCRRHGSPN